MKACFIEHIAAEVSGPIDLAALDKQLSDKWTHARAAWPDIDVSGEDFARHLAERCRGANVEQALSMLDGPGLYLACACLNGDAQAHRSLRRVYVPRLKAALGRFGSKTVIDDALQLTLDRLLTDREGHVAAISRYDDRSTIDKWLVVVALREGYRVVNRNARHAKREVHVDLFDVASDATDPELQHLKSKYRAEFKVAFHSAFDDLSSRERNLFRHQYLDGLNLEQIGDVYDISRATAARWRAKARDRLFRKTRAILQQQLALSPQELDSVMVMIQSRLEVSMTRLLQRDES